MIIQTVWLSNIGMLILTFVRNKGCNHLHVYKKIELKKGVFFPQVLICSEILVNGDLRSYLQGLNLRYSSHNKIQSTSFVWSNSES